MVITKENMDRGADTSEDALTQYHWDGAESSYKLAELANNFRLAQNSINHTYDPNAEPSGPLSFAERALIRQMREIRDKLDNSTRKLLDAQFTVRDEQKSIEYLNQTFDQLQFLLDQLPNLKESVNGSV